ncbi:AAA family ATPase [Candidatus Woesearchaeota archaeon]|nr:AAA family ATPase [Candidatus Woesearchaeota archaeon]
MLLIDKYKPVSTSEIFGQDKAIAELKKHIISKKPVIILGKSGTGKTSSVYALANEMNYEIVESNSSNIRNKDGIINFLGSASLQQSLFYNGKLILIDEVDGIAGNADRGGVSAITEIIKKSPFPVILTCNDNQSKNFSSLKKLCKIINFEPPSYNVLFEFLKDISTKENLGIKEDLLKSLAIKSNGDARAALLDLEFFRYGDFSDTSFLLRDTTHELSNVLRVLFKSKNVRAISEVFDSLQEDLDEINLWVDENCPKEYSGEDLASCFDSLSKADVFNGRIIKRQYYRFLVYRRIFMSLGVGLAKKEKKIGQVDYSRSSRILKMWIWNNKNLRKKSISEKIGKVIHASNKKTFKEFIFYKHLLNDKSFINELELNEDEIEWINKN